MNMNKEWHYYSLNYSPTIEQGFIFTITRRPDNSIILHELYMVNVVNGNELKTRVDIQGLISMCKDKPGGNIPDEHKDRLIKEFGLEPDTKVDEVSAEQLLTSTELLNEGYLDNYKSDYQKTIDEIIRNMRN